MSEWKQYTLDELFTIQNGYAFKSGDYVENVPDTYEVLKMGHIERGGGLRRNPKKDFIPRSIKLKNWVLDEGDIVMAMTDMKDNVVILGVPAIIDKSNHYVLNQRVARLKLKDNSQANIHFLYNYLKWDDFLFELQSKANSGVQVNLSTETIKSATVLLPDKNTQDIIADILSNLQLKIDLLHNQNETLEKLLKILFRQWFIEEEKDDWESTTLEQHAIPYRGLSYKGSGLSEFGNGVPMHNLNSVFEGGGYKIDGIKYYNGEYRDRHVINAGDIIVTNTEQGHDLKLIGFPAIVPNTFGEFGLFSQHIYRLVPSNETYLTKEFLYYLLMTPVVREQVTAATNGSTVNMLAIDGLQRPEFKLPPSVLVERFSTLVKSYWEKKDLNNTQIKTLSILQTTLLPKLMSAEITVEI
jgi:type I restriction enzyme S subunit